MAEGPGWCDLGIRWHGRGCRGHVHCHHASHHQLFNSALRPGVLVQPLDLARGVLHAMKHAQACGTLGDLTTGGAHQQETKGKTLEEIEAIFKTGGKGE